MASASTSQYKLYADQMAAKYGIPQPIFRSVIQQESAWNPKAVSSAGAIGLGQLMPGTASDLGVDPNDWQQNLDGSARYLSQQYKTFGTWENALAAYNAGPGNVKKYGGIPPFEETRDYVAKIMRNAGNAAAKAGEMAFNMLDDMAVPIPGVGASDVAELAGKTYTETKELTTGWMQAIANFFSRDTLLRGLAIILGIILIGAAVATLVGGSKITTLIKAVK